MNLKSSDEITRRWSRVGLSLVFLEISELSPGSVHEPMLEKCSVAKTAMQNNGCTIDFSRSSINNRLPIFSIILSFDETY